MIDHDAVHLALRNRALAYLPAARAFENTDYTPVVGTAYAEEDYVPTPPALKTFGASNGVVEDTGLYVIRWNGLANTKTHAIADAIDLLLARFTPGTILTAGSHAVHIVTGGRGQIIPAGAWARCTITIQWLVRSQNVVAA